MTASSDTDTEQDGTGRLETFSDGVFAIAMTLLVLDVKVPTVHGSNGLWSAIRGEWATFAAYLTSFLIIGIMWVNHHSMFRQIRRVDRPLLFLNLLLLLWTALLPFPTSLIAHYVTAHGSNAHVAAAVYSTNLLLAAVAFSGIWAYAVRGGRLIDAPLGPSAERASIIRFGIGTLVYAATVGLAFVSAPATLAVQFGIAVYYCFERVAPGSGQQAGA